MPAFVYTFAAASATNFTLPDDFCVGAAFYNAPLQVLGNYCAFLDAKVDTAIDLIPNWDQHVLGDSIINTAARFTRGSDLTNSWSQTDVTSAGELVLWIPQRLSVHREIVAARLGVFPAVVARGAVPASMPAFVFGYRNQATGADVTLISQADTTLIATYETAHWIEGISAAHTYSPSAHRMYWLSISGEAGANSNVGLRLLNFQVQTAGA